MLGEVYPMTSFVSKNLNRSGFMETLDWQKLAGDVTPDKGRIPYEPNKHLFRKVAFDVFQLKSGPVDPIWILEESDDGESYLVAQYSSDDDNKGLETKSSHWAALSDSEGVSVTLLYKNTPIRRFASSEFGFDKNDVHIFQEALVKKLASDPESVNKMLDELDYDRKSTLTNKFPEFADLKKKVVEAFDWPWQQNEPSFVRYKNVQEPEEFEQANPAEHSRIYQSLLHDVRRKRGRELTMHDVVDEAKRQILQSMGGAAYWCEEHDEIGTPLKPCPGHANYSPPNIAEEEQKLYETYGYGLGSPIEREIVKVLGEYNIQNPKDTLSQIKKKKKDKETGGRAAMAIWGLLERSEVDRRHYNTVLDNIISKLP